MEPKVISRALGVALLAGASALTACSSDPVAQPAPSSTDPIVPAVFTGPSPGITRAAFRSGGGGGTQTACGPTVDAKVSQALSDMARTLTKAETIVFTATTTTEDVSSTLQKLHFDTTIRGIIMRPNLAFIEKRGAENVSIWFDGATAIILDRSANTFLRVAVNGDLDALLAKLDDLQVEAPFGGLLSADLEKKVTDYVYQGDYYAPALIDDRMCHHLALRQENVDWQVWVDQETSLPKKAVITSKMLAGAPEHVLFVKEVRINAPVEKAAFQAAVPPGAREIPVSQ